MNTLISFMTLVLTTVAADFAGECDMVALYRELGCRPVPNADNAGCPVAFSCPDRPDPTMCYYKGIAYPDGTSIPESLIDHSCSTSCVCRVGYFGPMFHCAAIDCMESFGWSEDRRNCLFMHDLNSCCSSGYICGNRAIAKLSTCEVEGTTYREGQSFYPKNTNKMCICSADWNGSIRDPQHCKTINCGTEIHSQTHVRNNCAPVFLEGRRSCPLYFKCPSESTRVIRRQRTVGAQCYFGNLTLSVGDTVTVGDANTTCKCSVPPLVSCILKQ